MLTTKDLFGGQYTRDEPEVVARLADATRAIMEGRGSKADADLLFADLAYTSGYFYVAPAGTPDGELQHREGARSVFARILYLLDVPLTSLDEYRHAALTELTNTSDEGGN